MRVRALALIGRADRMPFDDVRYGGNRGLAQARAKWVHDCLLSELTESPPANQPFVHVLDVLTKRTKLLIGGPLYVPACTADPKCDEDARRLDRSVDLFACVAEPTNEPAETPSPTSTNP